MHEGKCTFGELCKCHEELRDLLLERLAFADLLRVSEPKRVVRSLTVTGPPLEVSASQNTLYYMFNFKARPSTTGLRHKGYIKFIRNARGVRGGVSLNKVPCVVDCDCPDYRYTWAWVNKQFGAGQVGPRSMNQAWNQAARIKNPHNRPGMCKHLIALRDWLKGQFAAPGFFGLGRDDDERLARMVDRSQKLWLNYPDAMRAAKDREDRYTLARAARRQGLDPDEVPDDILGQEPPPLPDEEPEMTDVPPEPTTTPATPEEVEAATPMDLQSTPPEPEETSDPSEPTEPRRESVDRLERENRLMEEIKLVEEIIDAEEKADIGAQAGVGDKAPPEPSSDGQEPADEVISLLRDIRDLMVTMTGEGEGEDEVEIPGEDDSDLDLDGLEAPEGEGEGEVDTEAQPIQKLRGV